MIRDVCIGDVERICEIYNYYILESTITFDIEPICPEDMATKIDGIVEKEYPYIVYTSDEGIVLGFAYCSEYRMRWAYNETVEISIYLDKDATGMGIGRKLLTELLNKARAYGFHTAISVISLPNDPSVALHREFGFQPSGVLKEVGYKHGTYVDISFWQIML